MTTDNSSLAERLKLAMALAGITSQSELARAVGVKPQAIQYLLEPKNNATGSKHLPVIAEILGVSPIWLATGGGQPHGGISASRQEANTEPGPDVKGQGRYPLISWVQAGDWTGNCEAMQPWQADEWPMCPHNLGKCGYVLRVRGASMTNPNGRYSFPEGMLLFVNPETDPLPGQFVIARRGNDKEATFKRYTLVEGEPFLEALNPDWPKRFMPMEPTDIFCGTVIDASFGNLP